MGDGSENLICCIAVLDFDVKQQRPQLRPLKYLLGVESMLNLESSGLGNTVVPNSKHIHAIGETGDIELGGPGTRMNLLSQNTVNLNQIWTCTVESKIQGLRNRIRVY